MKNSRLTTPLTTSKIPTLLNAARNYVLLHINHSLDDILSFHRDISNSFGKSVFVSIPYTISHYVVDIKWSKALNTFAVYADKYKLFIFKDNEKIRATTQNLETQMEDLLFEAVRFIYDDIIAGKKIIILEDGGYHYSVFDKLQSVFPLLKNSVIGCVEQTRNGVRAYYTNSKIGYVPYPVITVARSRIKMRIESHYIALSSINLIFDYLSSIHEEVADLNFIVIGYGAIGRQVSKILEKRNVSCLVVDNDEYVLNGSSTEQQKIAYSINKKDYSAHTLVIGTTGNASFTTKMLDHFFDSNCKILILVSVSSKQTEFSMVYSSLSNRKFSFRQISKNGKNWGTEYRVAIGECEKIIRIIGDGYPINFFCDWAERLPASIVDMIFAEMLYSLSIIISSIGLSDNIYFLGDSTQSIVDIEEGLLNEWMSLDYDIKNTVYNCWDDPHPCEKYLVQKM